MKTAATTVLVLTLLGGRALAADTPVAEVSQLRLYSSFWQNLHHFLYVSAWADRRPVLPGYRRPAMPKPGPEATLTLEENTRWQHAIDVYDREFALKNLLFDRGMAAIKTALVDRDDRLTDAPLDD